MLNKNEMINIYNENDYAIYGISQIIEFGYKFEARNEYGEPSCTPIPFSDVRYINNRSEVFRTGTLRFDKDTEEEIFKELLIRPKFDKNYLTLEDIKDIIINPTVEKLQKITNVTSTLTIEKIRGVLVSLNNEDEYDISQRVFDVINLRWDELSIGRKKSQIIIKRKKNEQKIDDKINIENEKDNSNTEADENAEKSKTKGKSKAKGKNEESTK